MKLDWSKGLIAVMALFIIFIVSMGIRMATSSQELYEQDYYEKGEQHTERMEQEKAGEDVKAEYNNSSNALEFEFSVEGSISKVRLIFLADNKEDFSVAAEEQSPQKSLSIPLNKELRSGIWYMEVTGKSEEKPFFKKQQFVK